MNKTKIDWAEMSLEPRYRVPPRVLILLRQTHRAPF